MTRFVASRSRWWLALPLLAACGNSMPAQDAQVSETSAGDNNTSDALPDASASNDGSTAEITTENTDANTDTAPTDTSSTDATTDDTNSLDAVLIDTSVNVDAASDVRVATDASVDASVDASGTGVLCRMDAECGGAALCLVGRCLRVSDEMLALASVPSTDRCRLQVGVDHPSGTPLRLAGVREGGQAFLSVRTGTTWSNTMLASSIASYTTPRFYREMSGTLGLSFITGTNVSLGSMGGFSVSRIDGWDADVSPTGELVALSRAEEPQTFNSRYPVRLWRRSGSTWMGDLVEQSVGTDGIAELRFRADGTPEVLVFQTTNVRLYRKALDAWNSTMLARGEGTHFGGEVVLNAPDGTTHVLFATRTFMRDPSVGELLADYLRISPAGVVERQTRLPVGGFGFTLRGGTLDAQGNVYAMITGPSSGGRFPTHLVRITPSNVTASVIANFETTSDVCSIAAAPDGTLYLAVYQGYTRPVLLRTYLPN